MKKYAVLAVAVLCLATLSRAQERIDVQTPPPGGAFERDGAPVAPPGPLTARTNEPALSSKPTAATLRDLSPWSMFLSADALVKAVMVSLAFASLISWTIFLAKSAK